MRLIRYRHKHLNFGDELNDVLWQGLVPGLLDDDPTSGFVGIGTIIGMPCGDIPRLQVFSTGTGNDRVENWRGKQVEYWCVRGPLSARLLGLPPERGITDGAILVPLLPGYPKAATGTGGTVIVPHFQTLEHPGWDEVAALTGYALIDPRAEPRSVIARIAAAKLVLTESLHGAILADVYGIPWVGFATSKHFGIPKWIDWTASIGRDLELSIVPPPDAGPMLFFGSPPGPAGATLRFTVEQGLAQFERRNIPPPPPATLRAALAVRARQAKRAALPLAQRLMTVEAIRRSPLPHRLLGFSPARTAAALQRLAGSAAAPSPARLREELRDRMLDRLRALAATQGLALAV